MLDILITLKYYSSVKGGETKKCIIFIFTKTEKAKSLYLTIYESLFIKMIKKVVSKLIKFKIILKF